MRGISEGVLGMLEGVWQAQGGVWYYFPFNFLKFLEVTNKIFDIFQYTWISQMSQISLQFLLSFLKYYSKHCEIYNFANPVLIKVKPFPKLKGAYFA